MLPRQFKLVFKAHMACPIVKGTLATDIVAMSLMPQ